MRLAAISVMPQSLVKRISLRAGPSGLTAGPAAGQIIQVKLRRLVDRVDLWVLLGDQINRVKSFVADSAIIQEKLRTLISRMAPQGQPRDRHPVEAVNPNVGGGGDTSRPTERPDSHRRGAPQRSGAPSSQGSGTSAPANSARTEALRPPTRHWLTLAYEEVSDEDRKRVLGLCPELSGENRAEL